MDDKRFDEPVFSASEIDYNSLMSRRISRILLICSSFDLFSLEEDGRLEAQINTEYNELNLNNPPTFVYAPDADKALEMLESGEKFDLVITMLNIGSMGVFEFARLVKKRDPQMPVVLLYHFSQKVTRELEGCPLGAIDYLFCWMGNADLLFAIVKLLEDNLNAPYDLGEGVQAILLVEDSVKYYSTYLPMLYKLIVSQSHEFLKEALNEQQQMLHRRARPKVLLARNLSEAYDLYSRYSSNLLGVISDISFAVDCSNTERIEGGIELCRHIRAQDPYLPFVLQSSSEERRGLAEELGVSFINKYSKTLLSELSDYITRELLFGAFVFTDPQTGAEVARADTLAGLQAAIMSIDDSVLLWHTSRNHLSKWMNARGLFQLGDKLRRVKADSFSSTVELRDFVLTEVERYLSYIGQGVIARFDKYSYNRFIRFARLGEGSIGGKARGLAFINSMLYRYKLFDAYKGVSITIPRTIVLSTDYFDDFIRQNGLQYVIASEEDDNYILSEFLASRLSEELIGKLRVFIKNVNTPLAVRSSSKLEDSHYQPFAGVYSTYMIPRAEDDEQMLRMLVKAIKSVYASVYFKGSRSYILASSNLLSEEKMAVVIQQVCGTEENGLFFPTISGVARSVNYYPVGDERVEEGVANIALGLGKMVVEGGQTLRFSPRYPKRLLQLSNTDMALRDTQHKIYALSLSPRTFRSSVDDGINIESVDVQDIASFRNTSYVASTWDYRAGVISDSPTAKGRKVITFASVLKYDKFPLAEILTRLLEIGRKEMREEVEIEFAVDMDVAKGEDIKFNVLQIRPIVGPRGDDRVDWETVAESSPLLYAESALGLGEITGIRDIVFVEPDAFDSAHTEEMARQMEDVNRKMAAEGIQYVLIGPGRWGSSDPWLGIPVKWSDISQARVIVECGLPGFNVEPSQGTHFFQNLTSFGVGYVTLNPCNGDGTLNFDRLRELTTQNYGPYIRHVRLENDLKIIVDGRHSKALIAETDK